MSIIKMFLSLNRPGPLSVMMALGNEFGNSIWEARIRNNAKPTPSSSQEDKEKWIRAKYEAKEFVSSMNHNIPLQEQVCILFIYEKS